MIPPCNSPKKDATRGYHPKQYRLPQKSCGHIFCRKTRVNRITRREDAGHIHYLNRAKLKVRSNCDSDVWNCMTCVRLSKKTAARCCAGGGFSVAEPKDGYPGGRLPPIRRASARGWFFVRRSSAQHVSSSEFDSTKFHHQKENTFEMKSKSPRKKKSKTLYASEKNIVALDSGGMVMFSR
jgi:hypothetical protein